jgi:hypothetical protein
MFCSLAQSLSWQVIYTQAYVLFRSRRIFAVKPQIVRCYLSRAPAVRNRHCTAPRRALLYMYCSYVSNMNLR